MRKREKWIKLGGTILCELFAIATIIVLFECGEPDRLAAAFGTTLLVLLPFLLERLLHCRISLPVYIFALFYAIGPMLGKSWKFYYTVVGWDKLLHISGGVMFALLGAFFFRSMMRQQVHPAAEAAFALCFSMAVAMLWEFYEFGADMLFGRDMQADTVVYDLNSYLLGDSPGVCGSISQIRAVSVDGVPLPIEGYVDIGLIDSMLDMLLETLGAAITCVFLWIDKGKHPLIQKRKKMKYGERICAL